MQAPRTRGRAAGLLLALLATGASAAAPQEAPALYHDHCSVCHGDAGDGRSRATGLQPPPVDFTTPAAAVRLTRERMIASVTEGRPGTAMAPWKAQLSAEQIAAVVDYVRDTFMRPATAAPAHAGRLIYARNCSVCHGDNGRGAVWTRTNMDPAPRDFGSERAVRELGRDRMITSVTHGRADTAMPGFAAQLSAAEIAAVVDYVRETFISPAAALTGAPEPAAAGHAADGPLLHGDHAHAGDEHAHASPATAHDHAAHAVAADMSAPLPDDLVPDHARGRAYYRANCVACHGEEGDGQGPRAYFILPKPRNFTHPAARNTLNRPALFHAIAMGSTGTEMPAWRTVLDRQTIADIAGYVFATFIAPDGEAATASTP